MNSAKRLSTRRQLRCRRGALALLGTGLLLAAALPAAPPAAAKTGSSSALRPPSTSERRVEARLEAIRDRPGELRAFMHALPKGGDLHNHLSGAVSTELLIRLAGKDGLCIREADDTALPPPCGPGTRPAADARTDAAFRQRLLRAWSMQDFPRGESGHDHFFATFGKFGAVTGPGNTGRMLADVTNTAARQHQSYLETMLTPASDQSRQLAEQVGYDPDFARMHAKLMAGGKLGRVVRAGQREADRAGADFRKEAGCGTASPEPGCSVRTRFISQASRASSPERVFTQLEVGMRLAEQDERFVAVNLVQPEDAEASLRNYRLEMRMLEYLHTVYPRAHITLHAGELTPGLVKPEDLRFHIRAAVHTGHAERIGHGVDLEHEDNSAQLLRTMARRGIAVEVPLTSNAQILGVSGDDHPFQAYRRAGVPVVLSTDDQGVSRTDITHEYQRATTTYDLTYPELKDLARASLEHAFLPGTGIWRGAGARRGYALTGACTAGLTRGCRSLLADSPKARLEWRLEAAFRKFEHRILGRGQSRG